MVLGVVVVRNVLWVLVVVTMSCGRLLRGSRSSAAPGGGRERVNGRR